MVTGEPHIRLYAGAPLITPDGYRLGTLCVTDVEARTFGAREKRILENLAALVVDELELRRKAELLSRESRMKEEALANLKQAKDYAETLLAVSTLMDLGLDPDQLVQEAIKLVARTLDVDWGGLVVYGMEEAQLHEAWSGPLDLDPFRMLLARGLPRGEGVLWELLEKREVVYVDHYAAHPTAMAPFVQAACALLPGVFWAQSRRIRTLLRPCACTVPAAGHQPSVPCSRPQFDTSALPCNAALT